MPSAPFSDAISNLVEDINVVYRKRSRKEGKVKTPDTPLATLSDSQGSEIPLYSSVSSDPLDPDADHELRVAATALYLALGGENYFNIATNTTVALEKTLAVMGQTITLARSASVIPGAALEPIATRMQKLLAETRSLVGRFEEGGHGSGLVLSSSHDTAPPGPDSFRIHRDSHAKFVAFESPTSMSPVVISPSRAQSEQYDATVLMKGLSQNHDERDDEILFLKTRLQKVSKEKQHLENNLGKLTEELRKTSSEYLALKDSQAAFLEELKSIEAQMDDTAEDGGSGAFVPRYIKRKKGTTSAAAPTQIQGDDAVSPQSAGEESPEKEAVDKGGAATAVSVPPLEALYDTTYKDHGLQMLWNCIQCVFKKEYDGPGADNIDDAYANFARDFREKIGNVVQSQEEFLHKCNSSTALRSEYVVNCLSHNIRPNTGVLHLLSKFSADRDVTSLSMGQNYISDNGFAPFVPLLSRLHKLRELDLKDNGIKNSGAKLLVAALQNHPSVTSIDLSSNPISRTGGKELLSLVCANSRIVSLNISDTQIDPLLTERIASRIAINAKNAAGGTTPSPKAQK